VDDEKVIVIYVDGIQVLAPASCIYIPYFARVEADIEKEKKL
jgi:hypothetical protein